MKVNLKLLFGTLVIFATLIAVPTVKANSTNYILENQGPPEVVAENERVKALVKAKLEQIKEQNVQTYQTDQISSLPSYKSQQILNYPNYQQEKNYYCGPAVVKQAVQFLKGSSLSQSTYASHMNTDLNGNTAVHEIVTELKSELGSTAAFYEYLGSNYDSAAESIVAAYVDLQFQLSNPLILHSLTKYLYMYNGRNTGHYLTTVGYGGWTDDGNLTESNMSDVIYVDSYSRDYGRGNVYGTHTDTLENITNSVRGRYLIVLAYY